jgi:hypothetical protein
VVMETDSCIVSFSDLSLTSSSDPLADPTSPDTHEDKPRIKVSSVH